MQIKLDSHSTTIKLCQVEEGEYIVFRSFYKDTQQLLQQGLDLLFPPRCAGCQRAGHLLCPVCLDSMQPLAPSFCSRCGQPLATPAGSCSACQRVHSQLNGVHCVHIYQGPLRHAIHALKYDGQQRLARPLGLLLAEAFSRYHMYTDVILPLPLHVQRQQERGYNQATLLARACATHLKVPCLEDMIFRQRLTRPQVGLNAWQRQQNVSGAFALTQTADKQALSGCRVLLIDDVYTTGATLDACAMPLRNAGVSEVWGLVLAKPGELVQDASKRML
jgi:ComF family protein